MAEAVKFLLDKLVQLLVYRVDLVRDVKEQLEALERDLREVSAFLKHTSTKKYPRDTSHQQLVLHICDYCYKIDDIVDAYVSKVAVYKRNSNIFRKFFHMPIKLLGVDLIVESLRSQIETYNNTNIHNLSTSSIRDLQQITKLPLIRENLAVDLEEETKKVIRYLSEESEKLDVIIINGIPGIGKTRLAWKAFISDEAKHEFPTRVWINVLDDFTVKEVYLAILKHFTPLTDDIIGRDEEDLARVVATYLESKKFLIVMDDAWSIDDWYRLRIVLPKNNNKGKVLITSCNEMLRWYGRHAHSVRPLTQSESWSLLRTEVFGDHECPLELEDIGKIMVLQCNGLPPAILDMARVLVEEDLKSSDMRERRMAWTKVSSRVPQYGNNLYYRMPYHMRLCFLYFGLFPYDYEFPVWKLICMWIAEGFIQQKEDYTVEEIAVTCLQDLIDRNLVIVKKIKSNGYAKSCYAKSCYAKSCRLNPMLHDFCRSEAGKEKFLQQIEFIDGVFVPPMSHMSNHHRLCIFSNFLGFLSSKPFGPRLRTLVCFSDEEVQVPREDGSAIPAGFKLLRVLDAKPLKFTKIPRDMHQLVLLRFLVLSLDSAILPANIAKLWNLQTLIVDTTSRTLEIKADLCNLTQFRHLRTNATAILATHKQSTEGQHVQTFTNISPESCTKELFDKARNLKKLGIRGKISCFFEGTTGSFDSLVSLKYLENLKLVNDVFPSPPSEGRLPRLPQPYKFPSRLRSLTLAQTYLDWRQMYNLGLLENLQVLKLKDHAFTGHNWEANDGCFRKLETLHIEHTDLVIWKASAHHFPSLRSLKLRYCKELQEVPIQLADIPSLQRLELYHTNLAADSAAMIGDKITIQENGQGPSREFQLSIYPPVQ